MRLSFRVLAVLCSILYSHFAYAKPAPLPPPLKNLEITGQITQAGKPMSGATVKAHFYNCDTKAQVSTLTNQSGYYKLIIPTYPRIVRTWRPFTKEELGGVNPARLSRRVTFDVRPIPVFVSLYNSSNVLEVCAQALNGGMATPRQSRFSLQLKGLPQNPPKPSNNNNSITKQQQCQAQGGKWEMISRGVMGCKISYKDGGKSCTDAKQCISGTCLAKERDPKAIKGACAVDSASVINSCMGEIKNGRWADRPCP